MPPSGRPSASTARDRGPVLACAVVVALVLALPVFFGVAYPYAIAAAELAVFLLLVWSVWAGPVPLHHMAALLVLAFGFVLQVTLLDGRLFGVLLLGSCAAADAGRSGMDASAAIDAFRRLAACIALFVVVRSLADRAPVARALAVSLAVTAATLLLLGILAPQDSQRILWFHAVPTYEHRWLSSSVPALLTDLWAYDVPHALGDLELHLDEFMVSSRPVGPVFNGNHYAGAVGVTFPVLLAFVARALRRRGHASWFVTLPLAAGAVALLYWLTDSVGGVGAMLVSLAVFFHVGARPERIGRSLAVVALLAVAVTVAVAWVQARHNLVPWLGARPLVWLQGAHAFGAQPWLGVGLGNYADLRLGYPEWRPTVWYSPHNVYLHGLVVAGLVGLGWLAVVALLLRRWRVGADPACGRHVAAGLAASLSFALAHAAVDYAPGLPFNALLTAVVAGVLLASAEAGKGRPGHAPVLRRPVAVAVTALAIALAVSSAHYAWSQARSFQVEDLVANGLARGGLDEELREALSVQVDRNDRACRSLPPRKDYLLAMAYAHLLLSAAPSDEHSGRAMAYLDRRLAIGRRDVPTLLLRRKLGEAGELALETAQVGLHREVPLERASGREPGIGGR